MSNIIEVRNDVRKAEPTYNGKNTANKSRKLQKIF